MPDISKLSVRDCTRMGKYSPSHERPRPLLVKLLRTTEMSVILSNQSKLTKSKVYIKPYMTPSKRNSESILLKERKSLISFGANPKDIKGKSNKLLLNGSMDQSRAPLFHSMSRIQFKFPLIRMLTWIQ